MDAAADAPSPTLPRHADLASNRARAGGLAALPSLAGATPAGGEAASTPAPGAGATLQGHALLPTAPGAPGASAVPAATPPALVPPPPPLLLTQPQPGAPVPHSPMAGTGPGMATLAHGAPLSPGQQLGHAMVALAAPGPDGVQTLAVRLDPAELGRVEVRIERAEGGPALVQVIAEKPETLLLLQRDQAGLARALDQAGIGQSQGRSLSFSLADGGQGQGAPHRHPGGHGAEPSRPDGRAASEPPAPTLAGRWRRAGVDVIA
jgi:hypothetical protein